VEGGWSITLRVPRVRTEEEWCLDLLDRDNVLVQPGYFYDFETKRSWSPACSPPGEFQEGIARIASAASSSSTFAALVRLSTPKTTSARADPGSSPQ
jgi:aspartate/methionine/tyrosine aminotransferase